MIFFGAVRVGLERSLITHGRGTRSKKDPSDAERYLVAHGWMGMEDHARGNSSL